MKKMAKRAKQVKSFDIIGFHLVADFLNCPPGPLDDFLGMITVALQAVDAAELTVTDVTAHKYQPQGVSVTVTLCESHLALHSTPEKGYLQVDIAVCGHVERAEKCLDVLANHFKPAEKNVLNRTVTGTSKTT